MAERIAVEAGLDYVKKYLTRQGYDVVDLSGGQEDAAAVVISGQDDSFLGMADRTTAVPVISAEGRTPEEVLTDIKERLDKAR
ncbi:MAG TPA: YkuS family protein [Firmicutes bacterium]|nr:YkuS family protein [Bacillota bacterium]